MSSQQFKEHMGSFFHDLLRAAGMTMTPGNINERLRQIGERMADAIEIAAEKRSIVVIRRLQEPVSAGFTKVAEELDVQRKLISTQQELIGVLKEEIDRLRESVDHIKNRVNNATLDPAFFSSPGDEE